MYLKKLTWHFPKCLSILKASVVVIVVVVVVTTSSGKFKFVQYNVPN